MVLPAFVPDCAGSSWNRLSSETDAHVHAQGEWRSSIAIVTLRLRLSAAACPPLFPNFRHPVHLRPNDRQHYQPMPELSKMGKESRQRSWHQAAQDTQN
eukprot:6968272-Pyramimonas_sp.AAC.1